MVKIYALHKTVILSLLGLAACYPSDSGTGSDQKSLDNFAQGGVNEFNWCGSSDVSTTPPRDIAITAPTQEVREAVLGTLASVPRELLLAFRGVQGQIVASPNALDLCQKATQSNAETDLKSGNKIPSCWFQPQVGQPPQIIVSSDPKVIRHSLIRAFTYFFTGYFLPRVKSPDSHTLFNSAESQAAFAQFEVARSAVTQAFLQDIATIAPQKAADFETANKEKPQDFSNFVLAEALDSCYCSEKTRTVFQQKFPKTWAATKCAVQPK